VAGPAEHASGNGPEGKYVTGPGEVLGPGVIGGEGADGEGPVLGADPGGGPALHVHGDGEGGAQTGGVLAHHEIEAQMPQAILGHGGAQEAPGLADDEVHLGGGDGLGAADEIAFVLALFVVEDDDQLSEAKVLQGLFDGVVDELGFT
jgi:hypothetical protein